jgi:hypothetical protein
MSQFRHHREFGTAIAFNLFKRGLVASCGWDSNVAVYNIESWKSGGMMGGVPAKKMPDFPAVGK